MNRELRFWSGQTDLAPVAIFRIVFGLLTINWFWQLYPNLTQFFTDEGIIAAGVSPGRAAGARGSRASVRQPAAAMEHVRPRYTHQ